MIRVVMVGPIFTYTMPGHAILYIMLMNLIMSMHFKLHIYISFKFLQVLSRNFLQHLLKRNQFYHFFPVRCSSVLTRDFHLHKALRNQRFHGAGHS